MKILSVGDRLQPGKYEIHSRFNRVINLTDGKNLLTFVRPEVGAGPINIVVEGGSLEDIDCVEFDSRSIYFGSNWHEFDASQIYDSRMNFEAFDHTTLSHNFSLFKNLITERAHPKSLAFLLDARRLSGFRSSFEKALVERFLQACQKIARGEVLAAVKLSKGCGFGLTPGGDDFIAGLLFGLHFEQGIFKNNLTSLIEEGHSASVSLHLLTATFLKLAKEGRPFARLKHLFSALIRGTQNDVQNFTNRLLSFGETSGADLITGFALTLQAALGENSNWLQQAEKMEFEKVSI
ncbi:MAG: DUF2877 domain-containing protein [bacterium]